MKIKPLLNLILGTLAAAWLPTSAWAQIDTGSDGHDGALNPTSNIVIDMADHPDGIYQYTSVNIASNITVAFTPNVKNTPVVWLVQGNVEINGTIHIWGEDATNGAFGSPFPGAPGRGGPGGGNGGFGASNDSAPLAHRGSGLGGGEAGTSSTAFGGGGSYASSNYCGGTAAKSGLTYGNPYLLPLLGGSGGGGSYSAVGLGAGGSGGGGGGSMLIASDTTISIAGEINADGGVGGLSGSLGGGGGSGGSIRLVSPRITGRGVLKAWGSNNCGGSGYVRLDTLDDQFVGILSGSASRGFNPILIPSANQNIKLAIQSIGGSAVPVPPSGVLSTPDATIPAQLEGPLSVVVSCLNLPLNTTITVVAKPVNGPMVLATAVNSSGTLASSTATAQITIPRGGGLIYATAAVGP